MFEKSLQRLRENDPSLTELNLSKDKIGDNGAKSLSDALRENTSLTTLSLGVNNIGDDGAMSLSDALRKNTSLAILFLDKNDIGDDGAESLGDALRKNTSLSMLFLNKNDIGDDGAKSLSDALRKNTSLANLDLWNNNIEDEGAKSIGDALRTNTSLTTLSLYDNKIGDDGVEALKVALSQNGSIINYLSTDYEIIQYGERNKRAHKKVKEAIIPILVIGNLWDPKDDRFKVAADDSAFEKFLHQTGSQQRNNYFFQIAKELWATRHDSVWWTDEEREEAKRVLEENKLVQTCIASHICDNKAILMEVSDPTQVFCSSYCQFMHYTGAPDLRGMNAEQIKQALN